MDTIIDVLTEEEQLSEYEALIVAGMIGILANDSNKTIENVFEIIDNNLKPIALKIVTA